MAIVIETEAGEIHRLPESLALDDHEISIDTPGASIPRRHGEWRFDAFKQAQPRRLTAGGSIKGIDKAEAERIGADLRAKLAGAGVLKLRRTQDSDQWIFCEPTDMRHNYHRGTFRASLFTLNITFEALDPWWYMARRGVTHETTASGEQWEVEHPGTYQEQPVMVRIMPLTGTLVNPRLECAETGSVLLYTGAIEDGQSLVVDTERRTASLYAAGDMVPLFGVAEDVASNVWRKTNTGWQAQGFRLVPGVNTITYTDGATSSHQARVAIEFDPRSW